MAKQTKDVIIELKKVSKDYDGKPAVKNVSFFHPLFVIGKSISLYKQLSANRLGNAIKPLHISAKSHML